MINWGSRAAGRGCGRSPATPALLLGELPRLQDTPEGYGPRGKTSSATSPSRRRSSMPRRQLREDAQLAGALQARTLG